MTRAASAGRLSLWAMLLAGAVPAAGRAQAADEPALLTVGVVGTFERADRTCFDPAPRAMEYAVRMAWEDYESQNPGLPYRIRVKPYDYEGDLWLAAAKVQEAAEAADVVAMIGYPCSHYAYVAGREAQRFKMPLITPTATADALLRLGMYVIGASVSDSLQGQRLATFAWRKAGLRRTLIVVPVDCPYCTSLADAFHAQFVREGGKVVAKLPILMDDIDFTDVAKKVSRLKFDSVFVPAYATQSAGIITEIMNLNSDPKPVFLGGDAWYWETMRKIVTSRDFHGYEINPTPDRPDSTVGARAAFEDRYGRRYGHSPSDVAIHAYDAATILFDVLTRCRCRDRTTIADALNRLTEHHGLGGRLVWNGKRMPAATLYVERLEVDKPAEVVQPYEPEQ